MNALTPAPQIPTLPTKVDARSHDERLIRAALAKLNCISSDTPFHYGEIAQFQRKHKCKLICPIFGQHWYIPLATSPVLAQEVVDKLSTAQRVDQRIKALLGELWLSTKKQKLSDDMRDQTLNVYLRKISAYPPIHAAAVLSDIADEATFFPAWAEIEAKLKPMLSVRKGFAKALKTTIPHLKG